MDANLRLDASVAELKLRELRAKDHALSGTLVCFPSSLIIYSASSPLPVFRMFIVCISAH